MAGVSGSRWGLVVEVGGLEYRLKYSSVVVVLLLTVEVGGGWSIGLNTVV